MDSQVELAKQRNRIAADRTLLSWIRISMTLISIGFGTENVVNAILDQGIDGSHVAKLAYWVGLALVALGTYAVSAAALDHNREMKKLQQSNYFYIPRRSLGTIVSILLIVIASFVMVRVFL